jgi:hypothetical protein
MKDLYALLGLVLVGFCPMNAQAQVGTSCMGCMPRTGQVYDSTKTTPSPSFTTSASTGEVYIPPREIIVTVPGPSAPVPVGNDPFSFTSTQFTCSAGGVGNDGARGAILAIYKDVGGRCADESGLTWWSSNLVNCVATAYGWGFANAMSTGQYSAVVSDPCNISLGNLAVDQPSMDQLCRDDAATRGFLTNAYSYVRGRDSAICSK